MPTAYRIGVNIAMTSNGAQLLSLLGRELLGVHTKVKDLEGGFNRLKLALGGALAVGTGLAMFRAFKGPLEEAKKYQTELARFKQFGMSDAINAEADRYARATKVIGTSARDMMSHMVEAQGVFRESGALNAAQALLGAKIAAPILGKIDFANAGLSPEQQEKFHQQNLMMLRFIEARGGANDPSTFAKIADWGFKLITSSGGNINWDQLRALVATAGAGGFNLTEDAISKLEPVITDLGGGTVGAGQRMAFQRLLGTQRGLPRQAVQEYLSLGLWDPSKVELTKGGGIKRFLGRPGEVLKDRDLLATNPVDFYTQDFLPAITKKYGKQILGDTVAARTERATEISMVFGPGSAGKLFSQIDKLLPAIQRSVAAQAKALGIEASDKNVAGTLAGKQIILQTNWQTLMLQLGDHVLPLAIKGMTFLNGALEKFNAWTVKNPGKVNLVIGLMIGVAGALTVLGAAAITAAGVAALGVLGPAVGAIGIGFGLLAGGLGLLAAPIGAMLLAIAPIVVPIGLAIAGLVLLGKALDAIVKNWDSSKGVIANIKAEFSLFWGWLADKVKWLADHMPGGGGNPRYFSTPGPRPDHVPGRPSAAPTAPVGPQKMSLNGAVYLDHQKVGKIMADYHADAADRTAAASGGLYDGRMALAPVGLSST